MLRWALTILIYWVKHRLKLYFFIISVAKKLLTCGAITVQLPEINNCEQTPFTGYQLAAANVTLVSTGLITITQLTRRVTRASNAHLKFPIC